MFSRASDVPTSTVPLVCHSVERGSPNGTAQYYGDQFEVASYVVSCFVSDQPCRASLQSRQIIFEQEMRHHDLQGGSRAAYRQKTGLNTHGNVNRSYKFTAEELSSMDQETFDHDDKPSCINDIPAPMLVPGGALGFVTFAKESGEMLEGGRHGVPRNPKSNNAYFHYAVDRTGAGIGSPPVVIACQKNQ